MNARMHAPADVFQPGQRFLKYLVRKKIGSGGMGEVYLAEDTFMQRELCLKVLPVDRSDTRSTANACSAKRSPGRACATCAWSRSSTEASPTRTSSTW